MAKKKITVVVIEDDAMLAKALNVVLLAKGYEVFTAHDGEAGEEYVRKYKPDCVLLDVMLPKKTGFEVLSSLKQDPKTKDITIIMLSNMGQDEDIRKGMALGAKDYFVKADTDINKITRIIEQYVENPS